MKNTLLFTAFAFLLIGLFIFFHFLNSVDNDGFDVFGVAKIQFAETGQFGDFVGGVVGTLFAFSGTLLIFLTFTEQSKQNKREAFESAFFEMVRLHGANISQMKYTTYSDMANSSTAEARKVFREIFREFLECYREVKKFSNSQDIDTYVLQRHKEHLQSVIDQNNLNISILELAIVDIAYNMVYYGVGEEGNIVLRDKFKRKYKGSYFYPLLRYIRLKPKRDNEERWNKWRTLLELKFTDFRRVTQELHDRRKNLSSTNLSEEARDLIYTVEFVKYYGGHQHRLGHYFRHLFQSYKYLNYHNDLSDSEKYFYGKMLRAQLSTYEQALLFVNSISSLGMKWEYIPEIELLDSKEGIDNSKLITRYNLIKNLPGYHLSGLRYKTYYPNVKYETEEDIL